MVYKKITVAVLLWFLSGCEHTQSWAQHFSFLQPAPSSAEQFDFNWKLSGDREVAPLQVFSTPQQIWLQFTPAQPIPAIFALEAQQQKLLTYKQSEPYVVITGGWKQLLFKGASLEAKARYTPPFLSSTLNTPLPIPTLDVTPLLEDKLPPPEPSLYTEKETEADFQLAHMPYRAELSDHTLRQTLKRWAQREGWLFQDQHWELEIDLPIVSAAAFSANFNEAVEQLMRSTALGTRPLQACFYNNKVMRVIALAQSCDPNDTPVSLAQG